MRLGFLTKKLDDNLIKFANLMPLQLESPIFYDEWSQLTVTPKVALLKTKDCWSFYGNLICFDLWGVSFALTLPRIGDIYFCVDPKQWVNQQVTYEFLHNAYMHPSVKLIVSSETHKQMISHIWKEPIAIVEKFNMEQFIEVLKDICKN